MKHLITLILLMFSLITQAEKKYTVVEIRDMKHLALEGRSLQKSIDKIQKEFDDLPKVELAFEEATYKVSKIQDAKLRNESLQKIKEEKIALKFKIKKLRIELRDKKRRYDKVLDAFNEIVGK